MTAPVALFALLGLGVAAAAVGGAVRDRGAAMSWAAFTALCATWANFWGVPPVILEVIGMIESSLHPGMTEITDPRAVAKGGSWGLFGLTVDTARDLLTRVPAFKSHPAYARWDGTGTSLLDPGLSAMVAGYYLAHLYKRYGGNMLATIAAYQQGPGTVDHIVARGGDLATELPPHGREYLVHAQSALHTIQNGGQA